MYRWMIPAAACIGVVSSANAEPVLLTSATTITALDTQIVPTAGGPPVALSNADIIVQGTTLTINGRHTVRSLTVQRAGTTQPGIVTHGQGEMYDSDPNTPGEQTAYGMWLEVTGDVVVQGASGSAQASRIDVAGKGYAGIVSNEPGLGGSGPTAGGGGHGGDGGRGGSSPTSPRGGTAYDSIEEPTLFGGSGGFDVDGFVAGGKGGGVIRLNVNGTLTVNGSISADGEASPGVDAGAGAGGSIWITASTLTGTGVIRANGGSYSGTANEGGGGGGRIALYALNSPGSVILQAKGGTGSVKRAGAGTVFRLLQGLPSVLQIDNGHAAETDSWLTPMSGVLTYDQLTIAGGARVGPRPTGAGSPGVPLQLTILGDCTVNTNSRLTADYAGYVGSDPEGRGVDGRYAGGGGHAGQGGVGGGESLGGDSYGSVEQPTRFGGCGGRDVDGNQDGGSGGGAIRLIVGGTLAVSGTISADGENSPGADAGCGAGGSVWITAGSVTGSGVVRASGGTYTGTGVEGGGGGGRVAVYAGEISPDLQAQGGAGWGRRAGAGTVYKQLSGQPSQLNIDNEHSNETDSWLTPMSGVLTYDQLTVAGGARVGPRTAAPNTAGVPLQLTVLGDCTVSTNSRLTADYAGHFGSDPEGRGVDGRYAGGGGHAGQGGVGGGESLGGDSYGSIEQPTRFGGCGGRDVDGNQDGGSGGGAIRLIVGGTLAVSGTISADGENSPGADAGCGAGGSVWITAGGVTGSGVIRANGGTYTGTGVEGGGGGGRVAVYAGAISPDLQAQGGAGWGRRGGAGTVYKQLSGQPSQLIIDNEHSNETDSWLTPMSGVLTYDQLTVAGGARVGPRPAGTGSPGVPLQLTVLGDCTVNTNSRLTADYAGYFGSDPEGRGVDGRYAGGGGHAGQGGVGGGESLGGDSYGSVEQPTLFGGCGGRDTDSNLDGGSGGGAIRLIVGGTLAVGGTISADGENSPGADAGCGAGGSVWITAGSVTGSGVVRASGGTYTGTGVEGGGGGGRVAVYAGAISPDLQAQGGAGWGRRGGAGTVYKQLSGQPSQLIIDNEHSNETDSWLTPMSGVLTYDQLTVAGGARVGPRTSAPNTAGVPLQLTVLGDCTINTNSRLAADYAGFLGSDGPGRGVDGATAGGGGHGGHGGGSSSGKSGGPVYDSLHAPISFGSGGGADQDNSIAGGKGGGAIRLDVGETLTVNGTISVDGENSPGADAGCGAGGSVWITAGVVTGSGVIRANGGTYTGTPGEGGGGGGRISLTTCDFAMTIGAPLLARGGNGSTRGCDGTIFLNHRNRSTRLISSNDFGYTTQLASPATVNSPPPAFNMSTWVPLVGSDRRQTDGPTNQSFRCREKPPAPSFVSTVTPLMGIDEVTFDDCNPAYYRFTFTLPSGFVGASLLGTANVDDAATVWLNGNLLSANIDTAKWNQDYVDANCRNALTWSTGADFGATNQTFFRAGVNELVFAVDGNLSEFEPTGMEFYAFVQHTAASNTTTVISRHPADAQVCAGETVGFSVTASGQGSLSYEWRKDGAPLADGPTADGAVVSGSRAPMLSISNTQKSDRGVYTCAVSNPCGAAVSDDAVLEVCACLACPADFNQDGGIDGTDVDYFFEAWETGHCDADVNADGGIDGGDVDYFFFAWENGGCG